MGYTCSHRRLPLLPPLSPSPVNELTRSSAQEKNVYYLSSRSRGTEPSRKCLYIRPTCAICIRLVQSCYMPRPTWEDAESVDRWSDVSRTQPVVRIAWLFPAVLLTRQRWHAAARSDRWYDIQVQIQWLIYHPFPRTVLFLFSTRRTKFLISPFHQQIIELRLLGLGNSWASLVGIGWGRMPFSSLFYFRLHDSGTVHIGQIRLLA